MPSVLLLNDTRDHDNWGSQATADALRQILADTLPGVEIRSLSSGWIARRYRVSHRVFGSKVYAGRHRLYDRHSRPHFFLPTVADEFETVADEWLDGQGGPAVAEFLQQLQGVDAVVFNAEGSAYRNNYTAVKALFMLWFARTKLQLPGFFLNGSVTLTRVDPILPAMVRKTFAVLKGVAIREPLSLGTVREYVPTAKPRLIPDAVFYLPTPLAGSDQALRSGLFASLASTPYFCFSLSMLPMDYQRSLRGSALVHLITRLQRIVPQAVLLARDGADQYLRDVARETGAHFFGPDRSYGELMDVLQDAAFLVSGRYHHIIMASMVGCPSVPLTTTSPKIEGLCQLLEGEIGTPFDATDLWSQMPAITGAACALREAPPERHARLAARSAQLGREAAEMGRMVASGIQQ